MQNINIAIQKKWYLAEETTKCLKNKWLEFEIQDRSLIVDIKNKNVSLYLLRNSDIPKLVEDWTCDFGILWLDQVLEQQKNVKTIKNLWLAKCRFSVAIPDNSQIKALEDLNWKILATSYPNIVKEYFKQKNIDVTIRVLEWSVEIAPKIWLADGIVDIVSTGGTLKQNNLIELETICDFEAVLIWNTNLDNNKLEVIKNLFTL
jgi:ATP phosphoribosyltransferase